MSSLIPWQRNWKWTSCWILRELNICNAVSWNVSNMFWVEKWIKFGFLILQEAEGNEEEEPAGKDEVDEEETERLEIEKKVLFLVKALC